jgi:xylulokinase
VSAELVVGVDIGTQSLKAAVVDAEMRVLGEGAVSYAARYPRPGWAEQDPSLWERALGPAIATALAAAERSASEVRGLAIAGQLDGCVPTAHDGVALGPCLIWCDRRAEREARRADPAQVRERTGLNADASHMAAKIAWLGADSAARFHQPVSFLVARLTGRHVYDRGLASTTMLYDLVARDYDDELLAAFGIDRGRLPTVALATELAGPLHAAGASLAGLPVGTPVAVGTGDDFSTPLGAGIVAPGAVACVVGTAEVVGAVVPAGRAITDREGLVETHAYVDDQLFVENPGWLSGGAVEWLVALLGLADVEALDAAAAAAPPGADGVSFLPALSGAMAPRWIAGARGCFYGFAPSHGRGHAARAVLEACAFAMRDVVDRLRALGLPTDSIRLLGGGARSRLWAQIRADVAGLPVEVAARPDTSPIGAAMLAAVAAGLAPALPACAARLAPGATRIDPGEVDYGEHYARYRELFRCLEPMFEHQPPPRPRGPR